MTLAEPEQLPPPIRELLKRFVRRRRRIAIARAVGIALALAALWLLAWGVVDRLFPLHWIVRSILLLKLVAIVMLVLARPLRALLRRQVDWPQAAKQIEQRDPRFGEALATVVSQRSNGSSGRASPQRGVGAGQFAANRAEAGAGAAGGHRAGGGRCRGVHSV
jgi:hypothetical protein